MCEVEAMKLWRAYIVTGMTDWGTEVRGCVKRKYVAARLGQRYTYEGNDEA